MANRAADAVMSGAHKSILSYHLEDPDTKTFLQVYHIYFFFLFIYIIFIFILYIFIYIYFIWHHYHVR